MSRLYHTGFGKGSVAMSLFPGTSRSNAKRLLREAILSRPELQGLREELMAYKNAKVYTSAQYELLKRTLCHETPYY